jgi:spore cortex biosynthesis protein YabQ
MESLAVQVVNFVLAITIGVFIGTFFDVYRVLRKLFPSTRSALWFLDLIWWCVATFSVFLILLWGNWGEVRFYLFLGASLGLTFYFKKLSTVFRKIFTLFFFWLFITIKKIIYIIMIPFRICKGIIVWIATMVAYILYKIMKFCRKAVIFPYKLVLAIIKKIGRRIRKIFHRKK